MSTNSEGRLPLEGVAILELSRNAAGAYCTRLLAALGADVVKVEPPGVGDPLRSEVLFPGEEPDLETGAMHLHADVSKKSITLDISDAAGRQLLGKLVNQSDVVVETLGQKERRQVGLDYEELRERKPELVLTSITGFGDKGPYADYRITEGVAMAVGGMTVLTGDRAEPPIPPAGNTGFYVAGEYAAVATVAARYASRISGHGEHIQVSIASAVASITEIASQRLITEGKPLERTGNWMGPARGIFPCRDGYIGVVLRGRDGLTRIADWLGLGDIVEERFSAFVNNQEVDDDLQEELNGLLSAAFLDHDRREIYHAMQDLHIPFGYVADFEDVMGCPQMEARGFFVELDHPVVGPQKYPSAPFQAAGVEWRLAPAPTLGENNNEIYLRRLGLSEGEYDELRRKGVV